MRTLHDSEVRNNLASVLDEVIDDAEPTIITRCGDNDGSRAVVIISLDSYNAQQETMHATRGGNHKWLMESIAQLRGGKAKISGLIETVETAFGPSQKHRG
jgi:antitoxin YefM